MPDPTVVPLVGTSKVAGPPCGTAAEPDDVSSMSLPRAGGLLLSVLFAAAVSVLVLVFGAPTLAAAEPSEPAEASERARAPTVIHSTRVEVSADVVGPIAVVTIDQTFVHDDPEAFSAVLVVPIPAGGDIDGLEVTIADRRLVGTVLPLEQIEKGARMGVARIRDPRLMFVGLHDRVGFELGDIEPGSQVRASVRLAVPVDHGPGGSAVRVPVASSPRIMSEEEWIRALFRGSDLTDRLSVDPDTVGTVEVRVAAAASLVDMGAEGVDAVDVRKVSGGWMFSGRDPDGRDVVIQWRADVREPTATVFMQSGAALVTVEVPPDEPSPSQVPLDIVLAIDAPTLAGQSGRAFAATAARSLLDRVGPQDRIRVLYCDARVVGSARPHPVSTELLARERAAVDRWRVCDAETWQRTVHEATRPRPHGDRPAFVALITTLDPVGLAALQHGLRADDAVPVHLLQVEPRVPRALLDVAVQGVGVRRTIHNFQDTFEATIDRWLQGIDQTALAGLAVDWGGYAVRPAGTRALPPIAPGQPGYLVAWLDAPGDGEIVVRGVSTRGEVALPATVVHLDPGRVLPTLAARAHVVATGRSAERLEVSVEHGVAASDAPFVLVDEASGTQVSSTSPRWDVAAGVPWDWSRARSWRRLTAQEQRPKKNALADQGPEHWGAPSLASARPRSDFLPGGTSATQWAASATGYPAGPSMSGLGAGVSTNTPTLGPVDFSDPVLGSPAMRVLREGVRAVRLATVHPPVSVSTAGAWLGLDPERGTNDTRGSLSASGLAIDGQPRPTNGHLSGSISGPIVGDHVFAAVGHGLDTVTGRGRTFEGRDAWLNLSAHPAAGGQVHARWYGQRSAITVDDSATDRWSSAGSLIGTAALSDDVDLQGSFTSLRGSFDGESRVRESVGARLSLERANGHARLPLRGEIGAVAERIAWSAPSERTLAWLGSDAGAGSLERVSVYASGHHAIARDWFVYSGVRTDIALGRAHVGPRIAVGHRVPDGYSVAMSVGRRHGGLWMPLSSATPSAGLPRVDEAELTAVIPVQRYVDLAASASVRQQSRLPTRGGDRGQAAAGVLTVESAIGDPEHDYNFTLRYRYAGPLAVTPLLLDDGALPMTRHTLFISAHATNPYHRHSPTLTLTAAVHAGPYVSPLTDPARRQIDGLLWSMGAVYVHRLEKRALGRTPRVDLTVEVRHLAPLDDGRDWGLWLLAPEAVPELPGWQGWRGQAGVRAWF